jgi:hypothetical protein
VPRAIFVSLSKTYPQIVGAYRTRDGAALRNCTCCWWKVTPASAAGVRYCLGVFKGGIVSAYRVDVDASKWPVMPTNALASGRRCIPAELLTPTEWARALTLTAPTMSGALRYGDVQLDGKGALAEAWASDTAALCDDEREPDE